MADRSLTFNILARDKASASFEKLGRSVEKSGKSVEGFGAKFKGLSATAATGAAAGAAAAGALAVSAFKLGAQLEATSAKAATVFGPASLKTVQAWSQKSASAMGLSKNEAIGLATGFADLLKPMGFTAAQAAQMSTKTIGLAGALSQWSGGQVSAQEAAEKLSDAMLGETDGLKSLGISISAAEVDAKLLAKGQSKLTGSSLEQAKAIATQELIFAKSTDAQAAFAKGGSPLLAMQMKLQAQFKNLRDRGLQYLIPKFVELGNYIQNKLVPQFKANFLPIIQAALPTAMKYVGNILAGLRSAFDSVRSSVERNRPQLESLGHAFLSIGKIVYGIMGPTFKAAFTILGKTIGTGIDMVAKLTSAFIAVKNTTAGMWNGLKDGFKSAVNFIIDGWNRLEFTIGGGSIFGKDLPSFTLGTPNIPRLAQGGIVPATPGGRLALIGEGGRDEAVIPLSRGRSGGVGGVTVNVTVQGHVVGQGGMKQLAETIRHELSYNARQGKRLGLA